MIQLRFRLGKKEDGKTEAAVMSPYICNDRYTERDSARHFTSRRFGACASFYICGHLHSRANVLGTYNALDGGFYANSFQK